MYVLYTKRREVSRRGTPCIRGGSSIGYALQFEAEFTLLEGLHRIATEGVPHTDDGLGNPLDEFISFQIKIVMQGTNSAEPPRIKELRALALVT